MNNRLIGFAVAVSMSVLAALACGFPLSPGLTPTPESMQAVENALVNNGFVRTPMFDGTCMLACWQYKNDPLSINATVYLGGDGLAIVAAGVSSDLQIKRIGQVVCAAYPAELCSHVLAALASLDLAGNVEQQLCGSAAGYNFNVFTSTLAVTGFEIEHGVLVSRGVDCAN